jgi:tRNA pseudouridine55 synthase
VEGFLCIDKPCGPSSFSIVARVRRLLHTSKAGHAGTLDPGASGLLIVALGPATRLLPFLQLEPKTYHFGIQFGAQTDTLDALGAVIKSGGALPSRAGLESALPGFIGQLTQTPPEFSAVKISGVRAYSLARQGRSVELASRQITIFSLKLLSFDATAGKAMLEVTCSGGTYVRSLARDLAAALGTYGYAFAIRRQGAGRFQVEEAAHLEKQLDPETLARSVIPPWKAFEGEPSTMVDERQLSLLAVGSDLTITEVARNEGNPEPDLVFAYDAGERLVAVLRHTSGKEYHPERVFLKG